MSRPISRSKAKTLAADPESGSMALEFALLLPFFVLILVGVMEFGHLFNVRQIMTNAGMEAARAAVVAPPPNTANRGAWAIAQVIPTLNQIGFNLNANGTGTYNSWLTANNPLPNVTFTVASTAGSTTGQSVTVTITASNIFLALGHVIPAFKQVSFLSQTTMPMD